MKVRHIEVEQGSPEWFKVRMGMPTASCFKDVMRSNAAESKTRKTYLYKLAGELLTGEPMDNYSNHHIERGKAMEAEARELYAFTCAEPVTRCGFVEADLGGGHKAGCSPDSFVGERGLLEIKTQVAHLLIETHLSGTVPSEHVAQCQGALWLTGREWCDLFIYWPKMQPFKRRVLRDEHYIGHLAEGVALFNKELHALVRKLK